MNAKRKFLTTLTVFAVTTLFSSVVYAADMKCMDITTASTSVNQDDCWDMAIDGALSLYDAGIIDGYDIHDAIDILYDACVD